MRAPPLTPLAAAALRVGEPERVLEVGCGEGDGTLFLAREFPRARIRGVDGSAAAIRRAQARVGLDPEGRVAFKAATRGSLPFPDGLFDLVALTGARPAPRELARVLRPGGYLLVIRTGRSGLFLVAAERLLWWRLSRHGIELVESAAAGDGSFSVGRRRERGSAPGSD